MTTNYVDAFPSSNKAWVARNDAGEIVGIADSVIVVLAAAKQNGCDDPILSYESLTDDTRT